MSDGSQKMKITTKQAWRKRMKMMIASKTLPGTNRFSERKEAYKKVWKEKQSKVGEAIKMLLFL